MSSRRTGLLTEERALLEAARLGDQDAFRRLVEGQRGALHAQCHRMLGSPRDAEDAVQETMVRAWRGLRRYQGRSSLSTWLRRIATNVCLDAIGWRPGRDAPMGNGRQPVLGLRELQKAVREPLRIEANPGAELGVADAAGAPDARYEQRETLELALTGALQDLPGRQRAVLLMREALGFSAKEVSEMLGSTVASTNSALQRARRTLDERRREPSRRGAPRARRDARVRDVVGRFVEAYERGDVDAMLGLLAEDATVPTAGRAPAESSDEFACTSRSERAS
jgi:RNA polymerase sigma-70 factor (ECF subfamily)